MKDIVTSADYSNFVLDNERLVIIDVYADWCAPCKQLTPLLETLATEHTDVDFVKINADNSDTMDVLVQFGVRGLPTVLFMKDKELKETVVGAQSKEVFNKLIALHK
jgi:thioredoxin 1